MKTILALTVSAAFVAAPGFASAQTATPSTPATPEKKVESKSGEMKKSGDAKKMTSKSASGTVKSAATDSLVVAGKEKGKNAEWTFAVDAKTTFKKGGKSVAAADVKAGDSVQVRYTDHDGKALAQTVTVKATPMAKKQAAPATKK